MPRTHFRNNNINKERKIKTLKLQNIFVISTIILTVLFDITFENEIIIKED